MDQPGIDDRSPMAKAISKVSEIIAICFVMVIPAAIGVWLDQKFSTVLLFTLIGLLLGSVASIVQLIRLVAPENEDQADAES